MNEKAERRIHERKKMKERKRKSFSVGKREWLSSEEILRPRDHNHVTFPSLLIME